MKPKKRAVGVSKAERRLVGALVRGLAHDKFLPSGTVYRLELDCTQGIADVVTACPNGHAFLPAAATHAKLKGFSLSTAKILSALRGKRISCFEELETKTGLSRETVRSQLRVLERLAIIEHSRNKLIRLNHPVRSPFKEIFAYEVKVKDWKSGLRQARSYRSFAHRAVLVLPLERLDSLRKQRQVFKRFNVGLLGVGKHGDLKWLYKPKKTEPISLPRTLIASVDLMRGRPLWKVRSGRPL